MLDTKNSPSSFHSKIALQHNSEMFLVYFALVLLKNQPLSSGKCERRVASKRSGTRQHWVSAWLVVPQAGGLTGSWGKQHLGDALPVDHSEPLCPSLMFRKRHGEEAWEKLCLQFNYYPKDFWLIWYSSCRCAAPVCTFFHAELQIPGFLPFFVNVN